MKIKIFTASLLFSHDVHFDEAGTRSMCMCIVYKSSSVKHQIYAGRIAFLSGSERLNEGDTFDFAA